MFWPGMRVRSTPATLLLRIPLEKERSAQLASFRQAIATLAQSASALGPPPLDGVDPTTLESAVKVASERGFVEELDFLAPGEAAVALYELSSSLPGGKVKRDLRRRVFEKLYRGNASSFVAVATRIALGSATPLLTSTLRARVALCLELPLDSEVNVAPLALALTTRSATHDDWIVKPSSRALVSRRTAARLYEHAAREALFRYQLGDSQPRDLLLSERWGAPLRRLVADREPLVWQHAAVAQGLLSSISRDLRDELEQSLAPDLTPTQWRRAAVALVAGCALANEEAIRSIPAILSSDLSQKDRGLPAAMVAGLGRIVELEPDVATELSRHFAKSERADVALAFARLLEQLRQRSWAPQARHVFRRVLLNEAQNQTRIERSLATRAVRVLDDSLDQESDLPSQIDGALSTFETEGAEAAYQSGVCCLAEAHELASFLETNDATAADALAPSVSALSELDAGVLERGLLTHLLLLGRAPGEAGHMVEPLERLRSRVSRWIVDGVEASGQALWSRDLGTADLRRLLVLLHLVDSETAGEGDLGETHPHVARLLRSIRVLVARVAAGPDALVHRVLCAALARSFDAAVRDGILQASDLLLTVASCISDSYSIKVIAEASTTSDIADPLGALSEFMEPQSGDQVGTGSPLGLSEHPDSIEDAETAEMLRKVGRLMALSRGLVGGGGYQAEALRRVFFRMGRALERVALARHQSALVQARDSGAPVLEDLTTACHDLAEMIRCAERRVLGAEREREPHPEEAGLYEVVERGMESERPTAMDDLASALDDMLWGLPESVKRAVEEVVYRIESLPLTCNRDSVPIPLTTSRAALPPWLLPRRAIGSFHVVRPLGAGGVSSVFLARRLEERNNADAESFALKVPEYDPATARSMTEQEFYQMFRDEAGALLSLPAHPNLARFVTFDLSARPKPILVMELIFGTPLDRLVRSRALTMNKVIQQLDGILAGLEAMHAVSVGHLDVKASNVILRGGTTPVLVDFGLSGRTVRPGCGTVEYTAPEVLGVVPDGVTPSPLAADIYSFGCLVYEVLTGNVLFDADDEIALVARHVSHDGWPPELQALSGLPGLERLAKLIGSCLRHDGRNRPTAGQLREQLTPALLPLSEAEWPLDLTGKAQSA